LLSEIPADLSCVPRGWLQFLQYLPGDFYCAHRDGTFAPDAPDYFRRRRVSVVIFLNGPSDEPRPNCYGGGRLTFYGLIKEPRFELCGLPLDAQPGMLVAFPADVLHEVRPVLHGERQTIVTWFYHLTFDQST